MLEVRGLQVRYGPVLAVDKLDLSVGKGEIVVLMGANGAGKSSIVNAIGGLVRAGAGAITLEGRDLGRLDAPARVRRGLALVLEGRGIFAEMTVRDNLELGAYARGDMRGAALQHGIDKAVSMFPRLGERIGQVAGTLSGGEQQMVAIARALMSEPRMLLLDEPSLGLAPLIVDEIAERLRSLAHEGGVTILVAEQNTALGLNIADRGYVLDGGVPVLSGTAAELKSDKDLIHLYLGRGRVGSAAG